VVGRRGISGRVGGRAKSVKRGSGGIVHRRILVLTDQFKKVA
jgi:hypothetical protein